MTVLSAPLVVTVSLPLLPGVGYSAETGTTTSVKVPEPVPPDTFTFSSAIVTVLLVPFRYTVSVGTGVPGSSPPRSPSMIVTVSPPLPAEIVLAPEPTVMLLP